VALAARTRAGPPDAQDQHGPAHPSEHRQDCRPGRERWHLAGQDMGDRRHHEGVGHDQPYRPEEAQAEVGHQRVPGVEQAEHDKADPRHKPRGRVEEQDAQGQGQRQQHGGGAEDRRAQDRHDEGDGDGDGGGLARDLARGQWSLGAEGAIAAHIEQVVEAGAVGVEPQGRRGAAQQQQEHRVLVIGGGADLLGVPRGPQDDEPDIGHRGEGGGHAGEVEDPADPAEETLHGGPMVRNSTGACRAIGVGSGYHARR